MGQGAIADTLTHALTQNRIAPAYLFCGPRGTGKTSSARILAKSLNCLNADAPTAEPCGQCDVCQSVVRGNALDIVEIDAASNTGVDNIRELIERAQFAPVQCRYKLFVLDEVHMLSTAAFNSLLKTLEEPPERVVFVLATTDPQRVLPTIISRCQRFDFRRIPLPSMIRHLEYIATQEKIKIAEPAIQLVAQISQGGLRDAESLLDQLSLQAEEITVESVWDLVGAVPERDLLNLVRAIAADDSTALLERARHLMDKGREPLIVLQSLVGFYRDLLIAKRAPSRVDLVAITPPTWAEMTDFAQQLSASQLLASQQKLQTAEVQVKNTTQPRLWLEITLTGLLPSALDAVAHPTKTPATIARRQPPPAPPVAIPTRSTPPVAPTPEIVAPPPISPPTVANSPEPSTLPSAPVAPDAPAASPVVNPTEQGSKAEKSSKREEAVTEAASDQKTPIDPPEKATPEVPFSNMADLWNKALAVMEPRGTQILMSQQGVLLGFDGVGAKVGFRSASLQKLAQQRVPNLEAAFEKVFQRKIKVSLEVVTAEEAPVTDTEEPPPPPPAPPKPTPRPPNPPNNSGGSSARPSDSEPTPPGNPDKGADANGSDNHSSLNGFSPPPPPTAPSQAHHMPSEPVRNSRLEAPTGPRAMDQDQEKIKRFANFFNGQIVSLDDDPSGPVDESLIDESPVNEPSSDTGGPMSSDPGPDVPF